MFNLDSINFDSIKAQMTPELMSRLQACETPEALCAVAGELGIEISQEQLTAAAGGGNGFAPDVVPIPMPCSLNSPLVCPAAQPIKDIVKQIVKWLEN